MYRALFRRSPHQQSQNLILLPGPKTFTTGRLSAAATTADGLLRCGVLYRDFTDWLVSRKEAPPSEKAFEMLVREAGFLFADGLVSALMLKRDFESYTVRCKNRE